MLESVALEPCWSNPELFVKLPRRGVLVSSAPEFIADSESCRPPVRALVVTIVLSAAATSPAIVRVLSGASPRRTRSSCRGRLASVGVLISNKTGCADSRHGAAARRCRLVDSISLVRHVWIRINNGDTAAVITDQALAHQITPTDRHFINRQVSGVITRSSLSPWYFLSLGCF
jgi:hypothetical protein